MAERINSQQPAIRLRMQGVSKRFGATIALQDVSIEVGAGQVLALVGENGAGKSTLMKVCSGAIKPDTGQMRLDGEPYRPGNPLEARRSGVAMIYQELSLTPHMSVQENIMLGMEPSKLGVVLWKQVRQRAIEAIKEFDNPELTPDARVSRLSVGSQQLVEIARALAIGCNVLVLDEPTSSLTQQDVERGGYVERTAVGHDQPQHRQLAEGQGVHHRIELDRVAPILSGERRVIYAVLAHLGFGEEVRHAVEQAAPLALYLADVGDL